MFRNIADHCLLVLFAATLCGCASQPDTRSARLRQAQDWAAQGEKAYRSGNLERSARYYEGALQSNTRIENVDGIAANLLSLAQIHLERGEPERAQARLQIILDNTGGLFQPDAMAEAAARSAQLALLDRQPGKAAGLAQQAQAHCRACTAEAAIFNLQAQAVFALGQNETGADLAGKAATIADKAAQPAELANAKRLLGRIRLQQGAAAESLPLLESALSLDKQLGLPQRIVEDLRLLADVKDALGQRSEAESYRNRERAVRMALENKAP